MKSKEEEPTAYVFLVTNRDYLQYNQYNASITNSRLYACFVQVVTNNDSTQNLAKTGTSVPTGNQTLHYELQNSI